ncbi:MAG: MBL fold metallo-hydrolase [Atopobiaceae bacterium]|nr:MBL fold metallo-hydrolase [Atopobiaceae bacterium]MDO4405230.1 MBL fold metallo-hydrolase [Atopobiaceae bacterium]
MSSEDEIRCMVVGDIQTNCYAYVSDGKCMVVDPGASGARIAQALSDVQVVWVVATHRHHDHVGGVRALVEATDAPWAIGAKDAEEATKAVELSSHVFSPSAMEVEDPPAPNRVLVEGDVLEVGNAAFRVYETPGHTPGGIILVGEKSAEGVVFVGDTLFAGACGRTDLYGGSWEQMTRTLERLSTLIDPDAVLLCGHGVNTVMSHELKTNPYLQPGAWRPSFGE